MTVTSAPLRSTKSAPKPKALVPYFAVKKGEVKHEKSVKEIDRLASSKKTIKQAAVKGRKHDNPNDKVKETKNAAVLPTLEANMADAKKHQVGKMSDAEKKQFNGNSFKTQLLTKVNSQLPSEEERANKFRQKGLDEKVKETINNDLKDQKEKAGGELEKTSSEAPTIPAGNEANAAPQAIKTEMPGEKSVLPTQSPLMPAPKPAAATNMDKEVNNLDQQLSTNEIKPETLAKSNEPKFTGAITLKTDAQTKAKNFKADYQKIENVTISTGILESREAVNSGLGGMFGTKSSALSKKQKEQEKQREKENKIRLKVKTDLDLIYDTTKKGVKEQFDELDNYIKSTFDTSLSKYLKVFEADVKKLLDENQGWGGLMKFLGGDKILDTKEVYKEATTKFNNNISPLIDAISLKVEEKLNKAIEIIKDGKTKTEEYWNNQDKSIKSIAKDIFDGVNGKYEELEKSVNEKESEVLEALSSKLIEAQNKLDESFEKIKEENKSWLERAYDAIVGVIKDILEIKNTLTNLLGAIKEAIIAIITDPIGFLKNLFGGIIDGFKNFGTNFLKHLLNGFISWLTGALPGLSIPDDIFSLKGIFSLVMQVLGLSWAYIRQKAVKLMGEPAVKVIESAFEIFMIFKEKGLDGVWEYLKEKFNDLKARVIEEIQSMIQSQVIEAGIKWIMGLTNPVGAFIKAAMAIIDTVKFFFQKAKEIISLVDAVTQGILSIARGNIAFVAVAVENALAKMVPLLIGFLANLLGLGKLSDRVKLIIEKIRKRIDDAIDALIEKARTWFKAFMKNPKSAVKGLIKWFGVKKPFTAGGKPHHIWLEDVGGKTVIKVASEEEKLGVKLNRWKDLAKKKNDNEAISAISNCEQKDKEISITSDKLSKESDETKKATLKQKLDSDETALTTLLINLFKFENPDDKNNPLDIFIGRNVVGNQEFMKIAKASGYNFDKNNRMSRNEGEADKGLQKLRINDVGILEIGDSGEHGNYKPISLAISIVKGGFRLDYMYENGKKFHTIIDFGTEVKSSSYTRTSHSDDLEIKQAGTRGRTNSSGDLMTDKFKSLIGGKIEIHSAHLIADWFSGSGYKSAGNLVPTSAKYNTGDMGEIEKAYAGKIQQNKIFKFTVKANIKQLNDNDVSKALAAEKINPNDLSKEEKELVSTFKEGSDLSPELEKMAKDQFFNLADPAYIQSVNYEGKDLNNSTDNTFNQTLSVEDSEMKKALGM